MASDAGSVTGTYEVSQYGLRIDFGTGPNDYITQSDLQWLRDLRDAPPTEPVAVCQRALEEQKKLAVMANDAARGFLLLSLVAVAFGCFGLFLLWAGRKDVFAAWRRAELRMPAYIKVIPPLFMMPLVGALAGGSFVKLGAFLSGSTAYALVYWAMMSVGLIIGFVVGIESLASDK